MSRLGVPIVFVSVENLPVGHAGLTSSFACLCEGTHEQKDEPATYSCSYDSHNTTSSSRSGLCRPVRSHPLGDFEDEPAEGSEADAPEKHDRGHSLLPFAFFQDAYDFNCRMASNKLLRWD